jgi:hypothetical protein
MDIATDSCAVHKGVAILIVLLPITATPTPRTRDEPEDGANLVKSLRKVVKVMEQAESTTQNWDRSRQGLRGDENATQQKETLT